MQVYEYLPIYLHQLQSKNGTMLENTRMKKDGRSPNQARYASARIQGSRSNDLQATLADLLSVNSLSQYWRAAAILILLIVGIVASYLNNQLFFAEISSSAIIILLLMIARSRDPQTSQNSTTNH